MVASNDRLVMMARDLEVLRSVWLYRYVTAAQLCRLHFGHIRVAQRRLLKLRRARLLTSFVADDLVRKGFRVLFYRLASSGARALAPRVGLRPTELVPPKRPPKGEGHLRHHLLSTNFRIWVREACRDSSGRFSYRFIPPYEEIRSHGRRRRRAALEIDGRRRLLIPDGVLLLEHRRGQAACFLVEIDRGTEPLTGRHPGTIAAKLEMYRLAFEAEAESAYQSIVEREFSGFRVLFVVPGRQRADQILKLAQKADLAPLAWVTEHKTLDEQGSVSAKRWRIDLSDTRYALSD